MSMEGLIALVVMLGMSLVGIGLPLLTAKSPAGNRKRQIDISRDELITSYERVLSTLRDLEDDYKSSKMNAEDYEREKEYWSQHGVRLLQLLDAGQSDAVDLSDTIVEEGEMQLDHSIEEAIHNYRVALQTAEKS